MRKPLGVGIIGATAELIAQGAVGRVLGGRCYSTSSADGCRRPACDWPRRSLAGN